jgi:hypothetical protein
MLEQVIAADGTSTYWLDGEAVTVEQAQAWMDADPATQAYITRHAAQAETFDLLNAATVAIREWSMDTQAWLYTQGASGTFDQAGFLALIQQAETAGLAFNALPSEDLTPALIQEQAGMSLRGQQAQILHGMALAAVMG